MRRLPPIALAACFCGILLAAPTAAQVPARVPNSTLQMPAESFSSLAYQMENLNPGAIGDPVAMASPPGDMRLFVVDRAGIIRVIPDLDNPAPVVFLDIRNQVEAEFGEEGLLGLAFHPDYTTNGQFYVYYTATNNTSAVHDDTISCFVVDPNDPNAADPSSEVVLIRQPGDQWGRNHNGGDLHFGPDDYLYIALGDGGSWAYAQEIDDDFFSGILRIDVDQLPGNLAPNPHPSSVGPYAIPADNPFVGATSFLGSAVNPADVRTEFFAVGLRNPWRFSIDPVTGMIIVGDVGEGDFEEVNMIVAGGNYGWPFREGAADFQGGTPAGVTLIDPIHAYGRSEGLSVIGGFIYRGTRLPELNGHYIFTDWGSGEIRALVPNGLNPVDDVVLMDWSGFGPSAFAPDPRNGDLLMCDVTGWATSIRRLVRNPNGTTENLPPTLAATGAFSDLATLTPNPGIIPYKINVPFWSDDTIKSRWFSIPDTNLTMDFENTAHWAFPASTVWIKHFEIDMEQGNPSTRRRLETRFLVKTDDNVYGATYRWTGPTAADLVPEEGMTENLQRTIAGSPVSQQWTYPSRGSCLSCHTPEGGHALGFSTVQLNCDQVYGSETENQINALRDSGYFGNPASVPPVRSLPWLAPADDTTTSIEHRARSWLHANCSQCHHGSGIANWDARISTNLSEADILDALLNDSKGDAANRVIAPGDTDHSMILTRIATRGSGQMPPIATSVVDDSGVALVTNWINELTGYQDYGTWSLANLGFVAPHDGDVDGDLLRNYDEYLLDFDPANPLETWQIAPLSWPAGGNPTIQFERRANRAFIIECSTDLDQSDWEFLNVPGNEWRYPSATTQASVEDITAPANRKFYRVRLLEP